MKEQEVRYFTRHLEEVGWIRTTGQGVEVLFQGYDRIDESQSLTESSQAFVAMWFDPEMDEAYEMSIKPAIENAGYFPMRIDKNRTWTT